MKVKRIYIWVAILLAGLAMLPFLIRLPRLKTAGSAPSLLYADFNEKIFGTLNRSDSALATSPRFRHRAIWVNEHVSAAQIAAALHGVDARADWLITVVTPENQALEKVNDGDYDDAFRSLCRTLRPAIGNVYLRWNPDMEVPVQRYAWQYQSPADYIAAFRHVTAILKQEAPDLKIVWGSAGYPGMDEYWPGDDVVDMVGVSIDGKSEMEATAYPREADPQTALRRKLIRTRFMKKPLMILAEGKDSVQNAVREHLNVAWQQLRMDSSWIFQPFAIAKKTARPKGAAPLVGVYDPNNLLTSDPALQVEHIFIDLKNIQVGEFKRDFDAILSRGHQPIVSVEPWRDSKVRKDSSAMLNTINGIYDEEFRVVFDAVAKAGRPVYVRFAHEMEIPIHRYSWQSQDPVLYVKAYRHFMELGKGIANVRKVWGPAGDRGSMEWYPGDDAVDFISIAIYGLPDKNITDPERQESFETIYNRKAWRMRFSPKPILITEFGVKGPEDFQSKWMQGAARVLVKQKEVAGACYFNLADNPDVWGNIPAPDWGISRVTFDHFIRALHDNE